MAVELVRWPAEEQRRADLRDRGLPRVLLVEAGTPPPVTVDPMEDWIRIPADDRDLQARMETLVRRITTRPELDGDGVLRSGNGWAALPPIEARLTEVLLLRYDKVVGREVLLRHGWPGEEPNRNVLDVHVLRLRRRIEPLGLTIRTIRKRGYVMCSQSSAKSDF
jgi:DNA-binding response OmpR family regulator